MASVEVVEEEAVPLTEPATVTEEEEKVEKTEETKAEEEEETMYTPSGKVKISKTRKYEDGEVVSASETKAMGVIKAEVPAFMDPDIVISEERVSKMQAFRLKLPWFAKGAYCCVIRNVFSKEECSELIDMTEQAGYADALINIGFGRQKKISSARNHGRVIMDSVPMMETLMNRVKQFIPPVWDGRKLVSMNERLRFLRYFPGEYFAPHFDGEYRRPNGERSYITVLFYMNEGFEGGTTAFLNHDESKRYELPIETGSVLLFQHHLFHEGALLKKGIKYIVRTDVMYESTKMGKDEGKRMRMDWDETYTTELTTAMDYKKDIVECDSDGSWE